MSSDIAGKDAILMQTAKARIQNNVSNEHCLTRILFDTGSQRNYVSENVRNKLRLRTIRSEKVIIKTFGEDFNSQVKKLDIVEVKVKHKDANSYTLLEALCVPKICAPLKGQNVTKGSLLPEFKDLELADANNDKIDLPVGMLIGLDHYFKFFKGKNVHSTVGVVACDTVLGWVLSGQVSKTDNRVHHTMVTTTMRCSVENVHTAIEESDSLREDLNKFWNIENIESSRCVVKKFKEEIFHNGDRYVTKLPFKECHDILSDNFGVCTKRLQSLENRLKKQGIVEKYDQIFHEYEENKIIERVPQSELGKEAGLVHYLPHRPVIREDKKTTKIRAVFDASCSTGGPSLNDCLYSGPNLLSKIFDVLLRFRLNRIGILADIKQAFLNVGIADEHKDFLRFLWLDSDNKIVVYRFLRVVFGITSSPFLLNCTIRHHLEKFLGTSLAAVVEKVMEDFYVDDLVSGCDNFENGKEFYNKIKNVMEKAGFNLRKWITNDPDLYRYFEVCENTSSESTKLEKDISQLDTETTGKEICYTVLGLTWNIKEDLLLFDFRDLLQKFDNMKGTKRGLLSCAASVFDPLGFVAPITSRIKTIFQMLCQDKMSWDDPIPQHIVVIWQRFISELKSLGEVRIPRFIFSHSGRVKTELHGFSDSSKEVYCAVIYLRVFYEDNVRLHFLTSKTRVAPLKRLTIPRLELMGCVLLAKLIEEVLTGLKDRVSLDLVKCWSDSQVSLAWIKGKEKTWKPWVENRVTSVRKVVDRQHWCFVSGEENPADIPTRLSKSLSDCFNSEWFSGPSFLKNLKNFSFSSFSNEFDDSFSVDINFEAKKGNEIVEGLLSTSLLNETFISNKVGLSEIVNLEKFGSLRTLVNTIAFVRRFISNLKKKVASQETYLDEEISSDEFLDCLQFIIREDQRKMEATPNFKKLESSLNLFKDSSGMLRLRGRFGIKTMKYEEQFPILLQHEKSHVTRLLVWNAHEEVLHHGLETTLARIRGKYWIIRGRKTVKSIIRKCTVCKRFHGRTMLPPPSPNLPDFRIDFTNNVYFSTGLDYCGPLFVRDNVCRGRSESIYSFVDVRSKSCVSSRASS